MTDRSAGGTILEAGELLIDFVTGQRYFVEFRPHTGGVERFSMQIPDDTSFLNLELFAQGFVMGAPGPELTNALDLRLGD